MTPAFSTGRSSARQNRQHISDSNGAEIIGIESEMSVRRLNLVFGQKNVLSISENAAVGQDEDEN